MSADNGIYILKTRVADAHDGAEFEYRVAHAQAIENINYDVDTGDYREDFVPEEAFSYFGKSEVFTHEALALEYAIALSKDIDILEYGICSLDHSNQVFPAHLTDADVDNYHDELDNRIRRHQEDREVRIQARLAEAKVDLTPLPDHTLITGKGEEFVPNVMYGTLTLENGAAVHGAVHRDKQGKCYFLPSGWNKDE